MTTLEDLYYGNISPHERYIKQGTKVNKLVRMICKNEEELNSTLTEMIPKVKAEITEAKAKLKASQPA